MAVRAGRLFNSNTGQLLARQVVLIQGERITEVGPEGQIRIPAGAQVIDLTQATVLPGLIDAHTHMFNTGRVDRQRQVRGPDRRVRQPIGRHHRTSTSQVRDEGGRVIRNDY